MGPTQDLGDGEKVARRSCRRPKVDERRRVLFSNGGHASSFPLFLFEEEPARKLRSPRRLRSESEQLCSFAVILAPVQAARVHNRVNLDLDRSDGWCRCSRRCVIHARNSSFPRTDPQDGERERQKSDVGSNNIFAFFLASRSWDVTFHGQFEAQMYILFQTKGANLFHTILHFIFAWVTGVF